MKLNQDQAAKVIQNTIEKEIRHADYFRTVTLSDLYKKIITGKDIESLLIQFNPREDEAAFNQRKRISKITTPAMASSIMKPFYKVPRTDRVVKKIIPKEKNNVQIQEDIQRKLNLFYGSDNEEGGLDFWLKNRFVELTFTDPNAFIVIEFDEFDPKESTPNAYPFEVSSEMAVNFEIENNNVDWLIVKQPIQYLNESDKQGKTQKFEPGSKYTIYCGAFSYVYRQISTAKAVQNLTVQENEEVLKVGEHFFAVSYYETKLEDWQSFRIGYCRDLETDGRTFVNPFHPALSHFESSIKAVSEFNLTNAVHVFPQKMSYVTTCPGEPTKRVDDLVSGGCNRGRTLAGEICGMCKGTSVAVHSSSQDIITIPLPEDKDDMFPLKDMVAYFAPPIELLKFQDEQIDKFEPKIHQAVFNSTVLVKKTTVQTATEKEQDMDSVYDTLTPFANKSSSAYLNIANAIALLLGYEEKVTFVFRYPSDFKMKNRQVLYNEIKTINDSGAPSFVKESVEDDLANQIYVDDPEGLLQYVVKKKFLPFQGKTEDQISFALNSSYTPEAQKILFINFDAIMSEANRTDKNFYISKFEKQQGTINAIVERYKTELAPVTPVFKPIAE